MTDLREVLRSLPVLDGDLPAFDPTTAPDRPWTLFTDWLRHAIAVGVPEPHATTLSTVDEDGFPDARVLILKDLDEHGWYVAASADSPKGVQLTANPRAALSWYWPLLARQVRVRGSVVDTGPEAAARDFRARSLDARAEVLLGRQSRVRTGEPDDSGVAQARLSADPELVAPAWRAYRLQPREVEFWQGAASRRHIRLRYRHSDAGWVREELWA